MWFAIFPPKGKEPLKFMYLKTLKVMCHTFYLSGYNDGVSAGLNPRSGSRNDFDAVWEKYGDK